MMARYASTNAAKRHGSVVLIILINCRHGTLSSDCAGVLSRLTSRTEHLIIYLCFASLTL